MYQELRDLQFAFLNTKVRVVALKEVPEIQLVGFTVGPFTTGEEYEIYYWVAEELEKEGMVKICEEAVLTVEQVEKLRLIQSIQKGLKLISLPTNFYCMARRLLTRLRSDQTLEGLKKYERAKRALDDLISMRLAILVQLALLDLPKPPEELDEAEKVLYLKIRELNIQWKKAILEGEKQNG